jgi:glycosyltransferase involved in cell wall biosynthesis
MSKNSIKISIIVAVYNSAKTLERCLDSLLRQTLTDIEIIAVDDGSEDSSLGLLREYSTRHPEKLLVISADHTGCAGARNRGIPCARGDYIGFVDSDDYVDKTMCAKLYALAAAHNLDMAVCRRFETHDTHFEEQPFRKPLEGLHLIDLQSSENLSLLIENLSGFVWDKIFRRELIARAGAFSMSLRYAEDLHFIERALYYCKRVGLLNMPLYYYNRQNTEHTSNDSLKIRNDSQLETFDSLQMVIDFYKEQGIFPEVERALCRLSIGYFNRRFRLSHNYFTATDRRIQIRFIRRAFQFFDANFLNWKVELKNSGRRSPNRLKTSPLLLKLFVYTPQWLRKLLHPLTRRLR